MACRLRVVMRPLDDTPERKIARQANDAFGLVKHERLLRADVTKGEIKHRLRTGALRREHRGVYRVGHQAPSIEASYLAAVWACGGRALLCDLAAAHLLGLVREGPTQPQVRT